MTVVLVYFLSLRSFEDSLLLIELFQRISKTGIEDTNNRSIISENTPENVHYSRGECILAMRGLKSKCTLMNRTVTVFDYRLQGLTH